MLLAGTGIVPPRVAPCRKDGVVAPCLSALVDKCAVATLVFDATPTAKAISVQ
jgi:hypothetical protein